MEINDFMWFLIDFYFSIHLSLQKNEYQSKCWQKKWLTLKWNDANYTIELIWK